MPLLVPTVQIADHFTDAALQMLRRDVLGVMPGHLQSDSATLRLRHDFGYRYADLKALKHDLMKQRGVYAAPPDFVPIPQVLIDLRAEAIRLLEAQTGQKLPRADKFKQVIVSDYGPGYKLTPHIDVTRNMALEKGELFYFGDPVIGVVLEADATGGLYLVNIFSKEQLAANPPPFQFIKESKGTAFLLSGPARHCFHGVSTIGTRRISVTFRTVHFLPC